jgi:hypothetical protein
MGRRAQAWSAAGAGVAAVAAMAAYLGLTQTYSLEYGSSFSWGSDGVIDNDRSVVAYPLQPDTWVTVGISVRNPGPVPVTLDGISLSSRDLAVEDIAVITNIASKRNCCRPQDAEPFHSVMIDPGDEANVWLTLRLTGTNPYDPCSGFTVANTEVAYRVLGQHRRQSVALPMGLSFNAPCEPAI